MLKQAVNKIIETALSKEESKFAQFYLNYLWKPKRHKIAWQIDELYKKSPKDFFFVQIGANDGYRNDPLVRFIKKYQWKGILIEPQPFVFEQLKKVYSKQQKLQLLNVAITDATNNLPFYKISFSNKRWATGLATFKKETLDKLIRNGYVTQCASQHQELLPKKKEDYIQTMNVATISLPQLFENHNISQLSLLQIDTEGYDFDIIKQINFNKIQPKIIVFEHEHLSKVDFEECKLFLQKNGYKVKLEKTNTAAFLNTNII